VNTPLPSGGPRIATRHDIPGMMAVRLAVRENRLVSASPAEIEAACVGAIEQSGRGWVVVEAGVIVGFAIGNRLTGNIWALFVHPDHEGRGHGRRLHAAMVDWLFARGLDRLRLGTAASSRAAAFYRAAGWTDVDDAEAAAHGEIGLELTRRAANARLATLRRPEPLTLVTERLRLRPLAAHDAPALFTIFSDPEVMRHWASPPWRSRADAEALLERDARATAEGSHLRLALCRHGDDTLIGSCTVFGFVPTSRRAEMGYILGRAHWGRGLMHEALVALVGHGFEGLNLHRIEADIDPRNAASRRTLERLGFTLEGRLRERWIVAGEVSDTELYGLLAREWRAGAPKIEP
jgi:RimJ/RimL family protein N-acetyltransferase